MKNFSFIRLIIILFLLLATNVLSAEETLFIYYPSVVKPLAVQQKLDNLSKDVKVTIFGKYRDFQMAIVGSPPDAILTKEEALSTIPGYTVKSEATRISGAKEEYVLMSLSSDITFESLSETSVVGIVDFTKRSGMKLFSSSILDKTVKLKHVTKVDDLLPLLSFKMASAIIVTATDASYLQKKSNLKFIITPIGKKDRVAVIATKSGDKATLVAQEINSISPAFMGGVEWKM